MPPLKSSSMIAPRGREREEDGITSSSSTIKEEITMPVSDISTLSPTATTTATTTASATASVNTTSTSASTTTRGMNRKGIPGIRRRIRSRSAPTGHRPKNNRRRLVEQHFKIDKENQLLPGVPVHDEDLARDIHDFFNLIILVPIVVLNVLNWNLDALFFGNGGNSKGGGDSGNGGMNRLEDIPFVHAWTGEYFSLFFWTTVAYFMIDLIWVCVIPKCVKSPSTIIQHHVAVFIYLCVPYFEPRFRFLMGVCMSVELNTWFLIARRVFNKQGFPPWKFDIPYFISVKIKLISILFYITWITIRCIVYPYLWYVLAFPIFRCKEYADLTNVVLFAVSVHSIFVFLNCKWSLQLMNSKVRQWKKGVAKIESGL